MNNLIILIVILFFAFLLINKIEPMDGILPCDNQCQKRRYEVCLINKSC